MKYDGSGWQFVGGQGFSDSNIFRLSLKMDGDTPFVAYQDYSNSRRITVRKFDGTNRVQVGSQSFTPINTYN